MPTPSDPVITSAASSHATKAGACSACSRIADARRGTHPYFITERRESVVVLHDHQAYEGWCVLLLKDHVEHLHLLPAARQARLAEDIAEVATAIVRVFSPNRINYECLGNQLAHVHWHVVPRYSAPVDPDPREAIWVQPKAFLQAGVTPERCIRLIERLRAAGLR